jgi:hypothetical protein
MKKIYECTSNNLSSDTPTVYIYKRGYGRYVALFPGYSQRFEYTRDIYHSPQYKLVTYYYGDPLIFINNLLNAKLANTIKYFE